MELRLSFAPDPIASSARHPEVFMPVRRPSLKHVASTQAIRDHFPSLSRRVGGEEVAYFDGPGGTQVPRSVVEAMADYLYHHNANTHWAFPSSVETDEVVASARGAMAEFLNASADEVAFGNNMTSLTFHLARALGRGFGPGDEVVVTELDHHANIDPWRSLEKDRGVTIKLVRMIPETGQLDWDDLERQVNGRTRLLAIGAASNALGTINDVARASRIAHSANALVFVDAVHYAPHQLVDVRAMGCDFLGCSAYKFYGPHVGVLYGRNELLRSIDVPKLRPSPESAPERMETGTQNHEGLAGTAAAVEFLASIAEGPDRRSRLESAYEVLHGRATQLLHRLWDGLGEIPGVVRFGPSATEPRTPTISFSLDRHRPVDICRHLATKGVFASHGDFYASTAVQRLGHASDGLVRVGCSCYNTIEEVDRLLAALGDIARKNRPRAAS
jgi:cysteine desulfurase family protein (TIGR01976 family)